MDPLRSYFIGWITPGSLRPAEASRAQDLDDALATRLAYCNDGLDVPIRSSWNVETSASASCTMAQRQQRAAASCWWLCLRFNDVVPADVVVVVGDESMASFRLS